MDMKYGDDSDYTDFPDCITELCTSCLPSAVEILKTAPSLEYLTIEICVDDRVWHGIDFSSLTVLAESSAFRYIDLYIEMMGITQTQIVSTLARYEGLEKLIERGVLVVHAEDTALSSTIPCHV
jgi:hypothetical protein